MPKTSDLGQIVILNGVPRSGRWSIVASIQATFDGPWMNLGVDTFKEHVTRKRYSPGIGLRLGGERPDLEPLIVALYAAIYESIASHSRLDLNVVVDVGHRHSYATPRKILADSARRLNGLPVLFVGIRCPTDVIMERRRNTGWDKGSSPDSVRVRVHRWQREVHTPAIYDMEVDPSSLSPGECAEAIRRRLEDGQVPSAFQRLVAMSEKPV